MELSVPDVRIRIQTTADSTLTTIINAPCFELAIEERRITTIPRHESQGRYRDRQDIGKRQNSTGAVALSIRRGAVRLRVASDPWLIIRSGRNWSANLRYLVFGS